MSYGIAVMINDYPMSEDRPVTFVVVGDMSRNVVNQSSQFEVALIVCHGFVIAFNSHCEFHVITLPLVLLPTISFLRQSLV